MYWLNKFSHFRFSVKLQHFSFVCVSLLVLFSLNGCSKISEEQLETKSNYFQSAQLLKIIPQPNYTISRTYIGQIKAKQETNISFEYAGKVSNIFVDVGDHIKKGQLLAQQNTQLLSYKKDELQAKIKQVKAQIHLNQTNLSRIKHLIKKGFSSKQSLDEVNAENQIFLAQIQELQATIKTISYQIDKSKLIAPFDATVGSRMLSVGEVVKTGTTSFLLIEKNHNEITLGVPGKLAQNLSLGQIFNVEINNNHKNAKLIAIGQQVNTSNRTVQLRLVFVEDTSNENVNKITHFNGQLVKVSIDQVVNKTGFWLPINAITDGIRGQWQVYLANKINSSDTQEVTYKIKAMTINVIHTDKNSVYITGLALEEQIIVSQGLHRFVYGQIIKKSLKANKGYK